ncbi:MAG: hypothetical protein ACRCS4_00720 [Flavobacterium sp.]
MKEFGFFGSLPVMVEKFGLDKSSLEYHFSRKKEKKFENEKYEIFKGELERGGSGTTGIACINTNRNYILIEKEKN